MAIWRPAWLGEATAVAVDLLLPPHCVQCGMAIEATANHQSFCSSCCEELLHFPAATCRRCAAPVSPALPLMDDCSHCRGEKFAFTRVVALGAYEGSLQRAVLRIKQPSGEPLGVALAQALARRLAAAAPFPAEAAVPVPSPWLRRCTHPFNPPDLLAEVLADQLHLAYLPDALKHRRWPRRQHTLPSSERRTNMRGAFRVRSGFDLQGARLLVVDDVLTTGATAHAAAVALKKAGAAEVWVAVLARGVGL